MRKIKLFINKQMYRAGFPVIVMEGNQYQRYNNLPTFKVNQNVARKLYDFLYSKQVSEFWLIFFRNNFVEVNQ